MTKTIEIEVEIIINNANECQCCYSDSNIFIEHRCEHLICLKCYKKMYLLNNRETCLYCDPLNDNSQIVLNNNFNNPSNNPSNNHTVTNNNFSCNAIFIVYICILLFILCLIIMKIFNPN